MLLIVVRLHCPMNWKVFGGEQVVVVLWAGLKIDASIELKTGELDFGLLNGKHADNRTPIADKEYEKDALHLRDLGYFNLNRLKSQNRRKEYWLWRKEYWLSRLQPRTKVFDKSGQQIDLLYYLNDTTM